MSEPREQPDELGASERTSKSESRDQRYVAARQQRDEAETERDALQARLVELERAHHALQVRADAAFLVVEQMEFGHDVVNIIAAISGECMANRSILAGVRAELAEWDKAEEPNGGLALISVRGAALLLRGTVRGL